MNNSDCKQIINIDMELRWELRSSLKGESNKDTSMIMPMKANM